MKTKIKKNTFFNQALNCEAKKCILVLIPLKTFILNCSLFYVNYLKGNLKQRCGSGSCPFFCGSESAKILPLPLPHWWEEWREKRN